MFPKEQMCSKLCVIIIFSYQFWLNCFQVQSCNSPQDLSNNRLQDENEMKLWFLKYLKHMFTQRIWAFPWGKFIVPQITIVSPWKRNLSYPREQLKLYFSPGNNHVLGEKEHKLLGEQTCAQGSKGLSYTKGITTFPGNKCVRIFVWS
jgi:hypothetical protein